MINLLHTSIFTVKFFEGEDLIGVGNVVDRTRTVHHHILLEDEVKLLVLELSSVNTTHPLYEYSLEVQSFCAWKLEDVNVCC